jgi:hypothetical protein
MAAHGEAAAGWGRLESEAPELAAVGRGRLESARVALLGTVRRDGSPRISPVEPYLVGGRLLLGAMARSAKARDLRRDPRCVLHTAIAHPDAGEPELKLYGRVLEVTDPDVRDAGGRGWWVGRPAEDVRVLELRIERAVLVEWDLERGRMSTTGWSPGRGVSRRRRSYP